MRAFLFCAICLALTCAAPARADEQAMLVLKNHCFSCHNPEKHKGGLVLTTRDLALRGGDNGPVLSPNHANESRLIDVLRADADPHMPPKGQLGDDEIATLRKWIDAGARWSDLPASPAPATRPITLRPIPSSFQPVLALAISPDGKRLAAARADRILLFGLESKDPTVISEYSTPNEPVYSLAWSHDSTLLASGGHGHVRLWDLKSSEPTHVIPNLSGRITALGFTPDGQTLIAADGEPSSPSVIRQWQLPGMTPVSSSPAHRDSVHSLTLTADGAHLFTASADKLVKRFDRATGKELATFEGHAAPVQAVALSPDGKQLASAGSDKEIKVWDLGTRGLAATITASPTGVTGLRWLDAKRIVLASDDGVARLASTEDKSRAQRAYTGSPDLLHCLALSPDNKRLYGGGHDGNVYVWSVESAKLERTVPAKAAETAAATRSDAAVPGGPPRPLSFVNDVLPVLSRAGCNAGACHAKPAGQSGFKLSVFAYDPKSDYLAITKDSRSRRVFPSAPQESLLLKKPTMAVDHGGGVRLRRDSDAYRLLTRWIEQGMPYSPPGDPALVSIEVSPKDRAYKPADKQPLTVRARYSDGTTRDVTPLSDFTSNEKSMATVTESGLITAGPIPGEATIVARYMGLVDVSTVTIPPEKTLPDSFYAALPANNFIDRLAYARLHRLGLTPSELCTDSEFIRRASLDAIGVLPTPEQVRGFLADTDPHKRSKLIDKLLEHPAYADHWAGKWADLLRPNPFRVGVKSVYLMDQWLRESFRQNKPYDQFARELLLAQGSTHKYGPVVFYRDRRQPADITTAVTQVFLGVRMECAKCHHHPNEKWSQEDFYQFAAYFGHLARKGQGISAPISGEPEYIWYSHGAAGAVRHPVTDQDMTPRALDAKAEALPPDQDPRKALANWMTSPQQNPSFAKALVNRVWGELMGRGIVHPVDDFRASNPATNDVLLDALAKDFVQHGYDLKHLIRTIQRSRVYQLSSLPNETNARDTRNFSRYYRKRPSAEVLLDAVTDITGAPENLPGVGADVRAVQAWTYRMDSEFLDAFSRPNPSSDPPCERDRESSIVQALHLMNSTKLMAKITHPNGRAAALAASKLTPEEIVSELYLAAYARYPTAEEASLAVKTFSEPGATRKSAAEDLLWALMNSAEFVLNH